MKRTRRCAADVAVGSYHATERASPVTQGACAGGNAQPVAGCGLPRGGVRSAARLGARHGIEPRTALPRTLRLHYGDFRACGGQHAVAALPVRRCAKSHRRADSRAPGSAPATPRMGRPALVGPGAATLSGAPLYGTDHRGVCRAVRDCGTPGMPQHVAAVACTRATSSARSQRNPPGIRCLRRACC